MSSTPTRKYRRLLKSYFFQQMVFCMVYFILLLIDDFLDGELSGEIVIRNVSLFAFGLVLVEFNIIFLVARLLDKQRSISYYISIILTLIIYSWIVLYIGVNLFEDLGLRLNFGNFIFIFTQFFVLVAISMLYHFNFKFKEVDRENYELQLIQKEQKEAELNALKSQLNPHFLFNTLNNIYSYNLQNKPDAPGLILKLSELTSYVLYDSDKETVSLDGEIEFLDNYIELEKIRMDEKISIALKVEGKTRGIQIAPLLFMPLVENIFKHGLHNQSQDDFALIVILVKNNNLNFVAENSFVPNVESECKHTGIGITNLKKRLALIYPDSELKINASNGIYRAELTLDVS